MIEPTDEMFEAFELAAWPKPDSETIHIREGLAAVLALVERQWQEQYCDAFAAGWWRGQHELCPRCGDALDREANPPATPPQ